MSSPNLLINLVYCVACNSKTPKDNLKKLAEDGNRIVRAAAKAIIEKRQ